MPILRKRLSTLLLSISILLAVVGGAFSVKAETQAPASVPAFRGELLLGMSAAFTGQSRNLGIELYRGSMAYFRYINAHGGVNGRRIVLRTLDDGYNPDPAMENTIRLIEDDSVIALFNYVGTPTVTRILPLLMLKRDRSRYLFFPFTGSQPQREPPYDEYVFNLRASYIEETAGLVSRLLEIGRSRIAVFYQADAYGRSGWDGVRRALRENGLEIAGEASYRRGASFKDSMSAQAAIIKDAQPDAVVSVGSYEACAAFIRDARAAGLDAPIANLSFVGSESMLGLLMREGGAELTRDLINSQVVPSYEDTSLPAVREYRRIMDEYAPGPPEGFGDESYASPRYGFVSFEGFLNAKVMVHVLQRLGENARAADIRRAAETLNNLDIGIDVPVGFSRNDHQGLVKIYYTTVSEGAFVPVQDWSRWEK
ncbi:ABC transporter substrate-binding protein [Oceanidesulfovibrio indonesiensis]|uniref:ABC transporter substrate-binding protein n=1 Tax=Oceanidesulfovibrio indonesiensis TaxID=54767 RepID=A0A7M3MJA3_9BACT|nr:ABC transporter substrate-binding protein [Oceanidesulfovibrio indonesiensis]TVM19547.1 ABC transporter substrate-binding protein [Oceanidesulfovibrio indonesiensis]